MRQKIIIDGYNLIHQVPELAHLLGKSLETAREVLIDRIRAYLSHKSISIILVFDGSGVHFPYPADPDTTNLRVLFSDPPATADSLIKEIVSSDSHPKSIIVVSSDGSILRHVKALGARVLSPQAFFDVMTRRSAPRYVERKFGTRMSPEEVAQWMTLFGEDLSD